MQDIYKEWYPLGGSFPFLEYIGIENIYAGSLKFFFKPVKSYDDFGDTKVVVDFERQPISYKVSDESYRWKTIAALPTLGVSSFLIADNSWFLRDFYRDAGELYKDIRFEHLLIVTSNEMFDFILDERPKVYTIKL